MWTITDNWDELLFDGKEFETFDEAESHLIEFLAFSYDEQRWGYKVTLKEGS